MNKKTKIIVSIISITIILLALLGLTYAYYLTRIVGNTNDTLISITTGSFKKDETTTITGEIITITELSKNVTINVNGTTGVLTTGEIKEGCLFNEGTLAYKIVENAISFYDGYSRPAVTLRADSLNLGGIGTQDNPYVVK